MFAKIDEGMVFMRKRKYQTWNHWGKESEFVRMVAGGYWEEITAAEAGDLKYADCSKCAENWSELFDYHHDGYLVSKVTRRNGHVKPGKVIRGTANKYNKQKYLQVGVNGKNYHLHRIVWEIFNGPIPANHVIENADDSCAKIENLKLISMSERQAKCKFSGTSGIKGVCWIKTKNRWEAAIKVKRVKHYLGRFDNINDAIKARINGEIKYHGKQLNDFPDYISPEEAEHIKQRYHEGEEMKQIEINTEPQEPPEPEFEYNTFRFRKRDIRINSNNYINLVDLFRAMGGSSSEQFRQQIDNFEDVPVFDYFLNRGEDYEEEYFAPPLMAQMFVQRLGNACDGVELLNTYIAYCNVMAAADDQADSGQVEDLKGQVKAACGKIKELEQENREKQSTIDQITRDKAQATLYDLNSYYRKYIDECAERMRVEHQRDNLEGQIKELHRALNIAREDRDSYQRRVDYWKRQYNQSNKAFGDEQGKRQKIESERDNLVKTNCELRQKLNAANNDDAKAKAAADKQTINDLRAYLEEAKETINAQQQEARNKTLAIKGYQLKVAELEDDKRELQNNLNILQTGHNILLDRYNKLTARNMRRRAAQKRYMGDLHNNHVTDALEWMQAIKGTGDYYKQRQQRNQDRYRKLIMALQDKVKELLYRLDKKPEVGFFSKVKGLFHH